MMIKTKDYVALVLNAKTIILLSHTAWIESHFFVFPGSPADLVSFRNTKPEYIAAVLLDLDYRKKITRKFIDRGIQCFLTSYPIYSLPYLQETEKEVEIKHVVLECLLPNLVM
jgi:hypothetical protein